MMRLLLISNSGRPFLEHCRQQIAEFLGPLRAVGYVTATRLGDEDAQFNKAAVALAGVGIETEHLRLDETLADRLRRVEAVFVSGGNTYALLFRLREARVFELLRRRIRAGLPYIGTSAGTNIAGPNILATNDWNVVGARRFDAMGLVPWTINPHYKETDPSMAPGSETRDQRIREYLSVNANPVIGIEEDTGVLIEANQATVFGRGRVKLFEGVESPQWFTPGAGLPWPNQCTGPKR